MAVVINRANPANHKTGQPVDHPDVGWLVLGREDAPALTDYQTLVTNGIPPRHWVLVDGPPRRVLEMDQAGKDAVELARLPQLRAAKLAAIETNYASLIEAGFEYPAASGKRFSLDQQAQVFLLALHELRTDQLVQSILPLTYNTRDDLNSVVLSNSNDIRLFFQAAMGAIVGAKLSGTALKNAARAASTPAALDAVKDL